jgi:glycosyltransferase involved in cell wall biosynthesis
LVVPSRQESFCQIASECHACGTPVVAFATSGLNDIVDHHCTGYLAEPFDPQDLAAGISWILADAPRLQALGLSARERAEKLWSSSRVASLYLDVYREVLSKPEVDEL